MRRPLTALLIALAASGGLVACGGGDEVGDVVPNETPELLPPGQGSAELPAGSDGSSTATTSTTDTTEDDATAPAPSTPDSSAPATPAPAPEPAPQPAPDAGGAPAAPDAGGAPAAPDGGGGETGGFSDFCAQNPGACGE